MIVKIKTSAGDEVQVIKSGDLANLVEVFLQTPSYRSMEVQK